MQQRSQDAANHEQFKRRWADYYRAVEGRPPRDTLLHALAQFDAPAAPAAGRPRFAVDLGCGDGRDTVELLRRGWRVLAIDGEPEAIHRLRQRPDIDRTLLETRVQRFEDLTLPPTVDLINASFCLPFCPPAQFPDLWEEITAALAPAGRFCGQFFGTRDSWASYSDITCHSRPQIEQLLRPFEIEQIEEEAHPGTTALGDEKYWHLFHVVARRR